MKNLFVFIALSVGLAVALALGALFVSLFTEGIFITVMYILSAISFAVAITLAVIGYVKVKNKK